MTFNKLLALILLLNTFNIYAQNRGEIVDKSSKIERVETGFAFTEGPAVAKDGLYILQTNPMTKFTFGTKTKVFLCI